MKKTLKRTVSVLLATIMVITAFTISTSAVDSDGKIVNPKISSELAEIVSKSDKNDHIPVYIFREQISEDAINKNVLTETGMDAEIYENDELFDAIIIPQIKSRIESEVSMESAEKNSGDSALLLDKAVSTEVNRYLDIKRNITRSKYVESNQIFINNNISEKDNVIYKSNYTSTIVLAATPDEILKYAKLNDVEEITYFEDYIQSSELDIVLPQINADSTTGTKSSSYNSGNGYTGSGIKIGIIEADCGMYDSTSPHLSDIPSSQLTYLYNYRDDGTYVTPAITAHATKVTALIVGQSYTIGSRTFEGVVPDATVYQTSIENTSDVYTAFDLLVDNGANVINYSGGSTTSGYTSFDKEIDNRIATTKVTFVKSAGNSSGEITSPGKAINAITVGNAATKSNSSTASSTPYSMSSSSSYTEASYIPNKPDITAPGTLISTAKSTTVITSGSGTSYAAPLITGVVAQSMQRVASLKTNPYSAKAFLVSCANSSLISTTNNSSAGNYLREKSGSGLIDAIKITKAYGLRSGTLKTNNSTSNSSTQTYTAGQKIRVILVFGKNNDVSIASASNMDNLDLKLINNSTSNVVATSSSTRNNIEIIEYTIPSNGTYYFQTYATTVQNTTNGVPFSVCWKVVS